MNCKIFLFQVDICTSWLACIFPNGIRSGRVMAIIKTTEYTGLSFPGYEGRILHLSQWQKAMYGSPPHNKPIKIDYTNPLKSIHGVCFSINKRLSGQKARPSPMSITYFKRAKNTFKDIWE